MNATPPTSTATITRIRDFSGDITGDVTTGVSDETRPMLSGAIVGTSAPGDIVKIYDNGNEIGVVQVTGATWSFVPFEQLAEGSHSFTAVVENAAGSPSAPSTAVAYTVDITAPDAPVITAVTDNVGSITGTLEAGSTTDDTMLQIEGTAAALSTIRIFNGQALLGTATASESGAWTYTTTALTDGVAALLSATASDAVGNESTRSASFGVTIDTSAPALPTVTAVATDNFVNSEEKTAGVIVSGTTEAGTTVNLTWGATTKAAVVDGVNWSASFGAGEIPADGQGTIQIVATDAAGNASAVAESTVTIDTIAPSLLDLALDIGSDSGLAGDGKSNDATPTLLFTAGPATLSIDMGDGSGFQPAGTGDGTGLPQSLTAPAFAQDGSYTIQLKAVDAAGNSTVRSLTYTLDTVAPTVTVQADPEGVVVGADEGGTISINGTILSTVAAQGSTMLGVQASAVTGAVSVEDDAGNSGTASLQAGLGTIGNDSLAASGNGGAILSGFGGDDSLVGSGGNDSLVGGAGSDNLSGGAGDD
ncbi:MAG: Ig-like domain-containing protein, partial [Lacisediminimonas sp.]|nr:Ig-like domain-containing protein [Lacisediminimonas sp.]